jgi:NAD+ kinase
MRAGKSSPCEYGFTGNDHDLQSGDCGVDRGHDVRIGCNISASFQARGAKAPLVSQASLKAPAGQERLPRALAFISADTPDAQEAAARLSALYGQSSIAEADVIVALGGDGFMLQTLHDHMDSGRRIYGMNRGTIGFLMNEYAEQDLRERIGAAVAETIRPLVMETVDENGIRHTERAINEIALFRQSAQAAKLRITIDGKVRLDELICDGVMVASPAGSTAYNLSAHGPILPLDAPLLALTPVSPFRPRRWRGALLPNHSVVHFDVLEARKRPVNAVADHTEVRSVVSVTVREARSSTVTLLFDESHSWDERILTEQFRY